MLMEPSTQRRFSPRLKNIPESERPYYGTSPKKSFHQSDDKTSERNAVDTSSSSLNSEINGVHECGTDLNHHKRKHGPPHWRPKDAGDRGLKSGTEILNASTSSIQDLGGDSGNIDSEVDYKKWLDVDYSSSGADGKSAYARVKDTLRIFHKYYLQFVQEDNRCRSLEDDVQEVANDLKSKKRGRHEENTKQSIKRPDLKAISKMLKSNEILFPKKTFGHLPGIDVGYQFYSRAEMVALGFHSHWLNGIDYVGKSRRKMEDIKDSSFPLAVSVVLSGQYEDDQDNFEDVVYTGQGGNDLLGNKRQVKNQVMSRGNLALSNNMEQSLPVRVVRGHKSYHSYSGKLYTYDGLYKVIKCWTEKGASGFLVYKYHLRRIEGQPKLTTNQVYFTPRNGVKALSMPGLVSEDISGGQEEKCIPATNIIDDEPVAPTGFTYSKSIQVEENLDLPFNAVGCKCKGNCTNPRTCSCAKLNGSDFPYVRQNGGRLVEAKDIVFECGPNCGCGPGCINRTSQQGIKYQLEVFRTPDKGWAVRSRDFIPSGASVCEYIGVLRRTDEMDTVAENDYIFEIDCLHTMKGIGGRERRWGGDASASVVDHLDDHKLESAPEFCIDAGSTGNVARFINHSCEPNLFVQCVLSTHHDVRLARVVLFAAESIAPLQELTYDYGYALDSVVGPNGEIRKQACHCGTADCRKRLY